MLEQNSKSFLPNGGEKSWWIPWERIRKATTVNYSSTHWPGASQWLSRLSQALKTKTAISRAGCTSGDNPRSSFIFPFLFDKQNRTWVDHLHPIFHHLEENRRWCEANVPWHCRPCWSATLPKLNSSPLKSYRPNTKGRFIEILKFLVKNKMSCFF